MSSNLQPAFKSTTLSAGGDAAAILAAGAALATPQTNPDKDGKPYALVPEGYDLTELPERSFPPRAKGLAKLRDAASFVAYVNRFKGDDTQLYATLTPARFLCVFDDFQGNLADGASVHDISAWREWRAQFEPAASREWTTWLTLDRKPLTQLQLAEHLQDNLPDVTQPDGATLLQMALNFEAATSGAFVAAQRLQDGSHNLQWKADNNASGSVKLPEMITLSIPVFENGEAMELQARLRYRITDKLTLTYELVRPWRVQEAAFRAIWAQIAEQTALPVLLGTPE